MARSITAMKAERQQSVVAAAALTVVVWSSAFIAIRYERHTFGPGELALGRLLVGSVALGALMIARREPLPPRRSLPGIAVCGVLWFGVYNVALNAAERRVAAGIAALLVNVGPIFIAILAGIVLKEGFPKLLLVGCLVAFSGAALIGIAGSRHHVGAAWGVVLCLIAALTYAAGVVAQKPVLDHSSPLTVTWLACTIGAVTCLPYAPSLVDELGRATAGQTAWIVYLGLAPTTIGFLAWGYALSHTTAGRMGSVTYLVPPVALLLGWPILGEVPPLLAIPGGALCLAGVALARWRPAPARATAQPPSHRRP
jgi:drug/metabolite transporter (DMT)-like permease